MIRSPQLRGQGLPPDPPSPLGGSVDARRGLVNGWAELPHFCYLVASSGPLSPELIRMNRRGTPYITRVPSQRMLDRMKLDTKRRKFRQLGPRTPRSASQGGRPPGFPGGLAMGDDRDRDAAAQPGPPSRAVSLAPRLLAASLAGSRARASVLELIEPNEPPRFYGATCVSKCGTTGRICFEVTTARPARLQRGPVQLTIDFGKLTWSQYPGPGVKIALTRGLRKPP
jgi:hypothetical protein